MTNRLRYLPILAAGSLLASGLASCNDDSLDDATKEWQELNRKYVSDQSELSQDGKKVYSRISPDWAPTAFVLMKWHNDRSATAANLQPLDNSTCYVKYEFEDINGNKIQDSYDAQTYGDSIYRCRPCDNIVGFWTALRNMHVGDSVTVIIPAEAGYGGTSMSDIKAYSTLIYHIKLKSVPAFETPLEKK